MTKIEEMVERFIKQWACIKIDDESMDEPLKLLIQNSASEMRADLMAIVDEATSPIHKEVESLRKELTEYYKQDNQTHRLIAKIEILEAKNETLQELVMPMFSWLSDALEEHRRDAFTTCPEDCWCWEVEALVNKTEQTLKEQVDGEGR